MENSKATGALAQFMDEEHWRRLRQADQDCSTAIRSQLALLEFEERAEALCREAGVPQATRLGDPDLRVRLAEFTDRVYRLKIGHLSLRP